MIPAMHRLLFVVFSSAFAAPHIPEFDSSDVIQGPLTKDFQLWLKLNGYGAYNFERLDLGTTGSYGGRLPHRGNAVRRTNFRPIVFVHGNSDGALTDGTKWGTGWTSSISYFLSRGYSTDELYATTWGNRVAADSWNRTHNCDTVDRVRKFIEAVIGYTGVDQVDVIGHSMGVTVARKAIRGGYISQPPGCDLGGTLRDSIHVFVGISGANYGMCGCAGPEVASLPSCNPINGFYPGDPCPELTQVENSPALVCGTTRTCAPSTYAGLLYGMNNDPTNEASYVFAFWSKADDLIGYSDNVFNRQTSYIPYNQGTWVFANLTHMQTKDATGAVQYNLVNKLSFT